MLDRRLAPNTNMQRCSCRSMARVLAIVQLALLPPCTPPLATAPHAGASLPSGDPQPRTGTALSRISWPCEVEQAQTPRSRYAPLKRGACVAGLRGFNHAGGVGHLWRLRNTAGVGCPTPTVTPGRDLSSTPMRIPRLTDPTGLAAQETPRGGRRLRRASRLGGHARTGGA